ncbi:peptidase inhibitor family I36 protein [Streptomyces sp. NPDC049040]|uniref:peptidase inhibitor family I36 protein n=1 Tax=Streptomyces sp. NPDC049040 TaxID=3365593 RepID=UPI003715173F
MRKHHALALLASIAAFGFFGSTSASAAQPAASVETAHGSVAPAAKSDCPAGSFCVWVNSNYSDGPAKFSGNNSDWTQFSHASCASGTWNNCATSGFNNGTSGLGVVVWQLVGGSGDGACLPRGWALSDFQGYVWPNTTDSFNDSISANVWSSNC